MPRGSPPRSRTDGEAGVAASSRALATAVIMSSARSRLERLQPRAHRIAADAPEMDVHVDQAGQDELVLAGRPASRRLRAATKPSRTSAILPSRTMIVLLPRGASPGRSSSCAGVDVGDLGAAAAARSGRSERRGGDAPARAAISVLHAWHLPVSVVDACAGRDRGDTGRASAFFATLSSIRASCSGVASPLCAPSTRHRACRRSPRAPSSLSVSPPASSTQSDRQLRQKPASPIRSMFCASLRWRRWRTRRRKAAAATSRRRVRRARPS